MRLIDADRLKEVVSKNFYGEAGADVMCQIIDEQPTAFDKEKVLSNIYEIYAEINNTVLKTGNYEIVTTVANLINRAEKIIERGEVDG